MTDMPDPWINKTSEGTRALAFDVQHDGKTIHIGLVSADAEVDEMVTMLMNLPLMLEKMVPALVDSPTFDSKVRPSAGDQVMLNLGVIADQLRARHQQKYGHTHG